MQTLIFAAEAAPSDLWSMIAEYLNLKQYPLVFLCVLWILDLRRTNQALHKRNNELEELMRGLNDKIRDDIVPLLTRLLDLVPTLVNRARNQK